jgi:hypothetical protein
MKSTIFDLSVLNYINKNLKLKVFKCLYGFLFSVILHFKLIILFQIIIYNNDKMIINNNGNNDNIKYYRNFPSNH